MERYTYEQYNDLNWQSQDTTQLNSKINTHVAQEILTAPGSVFEIGFGIGCFLEQIFPKLKQYEKELQGCEPAEKNYSYFLTKEISKEIKTYNAPFLAVTVPQTFDYITASFVILHIPFDDLDLSAKKINVLLNPSGRFIMILPEDDFQKKRIAKENATIETREITLDGKSYPEVVHYTSLPGVGKIIDCTRPEAFYISLFKKQGLELVKKDTIKDNDDVITMFIFQKI